MQRRLRLTVKLDGLSESEIAFSDSSTVLFFQLKIDLGFERDK